MPAAILVPEIGTSEVMSWVTADGVEHMLDGTAGVWIMPGMSGRWMPPIDHAQAELAFGDGSRILGTFVRARTIELPLVGVAEGILATRQLMRTILGWFDPRREGTLRCVAPDGVVREIPGRPVLEIAEGSLMERSPDHHVMLLSLTCPDPYWLGVEASQTFINASVPSSLFFKVPFFPFRVVSSAVLAYTVILNEGDGVAWPVWTLTGPLTNPAVRNLTMGRLLALTRVILAGDVVTIDTRPGYKTVTDAGGANLFASLAAGSELWSLAPGSNTIQVEGQNTTAAPTLLSQNLSAYWLGGETDGPSYDSVGALTLADNNTVTSAAGQTGLARHFAAASSEYLSTPSNAALSAGAGVSIAIAAWVYLDSKSGNMVIAAKWTSAGNQRGPVLQYEVATDRFRFAVSSDGVDFYSVDAVTLGSPALATWYLVVGWCDLASQTIGISVNAGAADTAAGPTIVFANTSPFTIGALANPSSYMDGRIYRVGFWRGRVPSIGERAELYADGVGLPYPFVGAARTNTPATSIGLAYRERSFSP